jgi:hypothetical protein
VARRRRSGGMTDVARRRARPHSPEPGWQRPPGEDGRVAEVRPVAPATVELTRAIVPRATPGHVIDELEDAVRVNPQTEILRARSALPRVALSPAPVRQAYALTLLPQTSWTVSLCGSGTSTPALDRVGLITSSHAC